MNTVLAVAIAENHLRSKVVGALGRFLSTSIEVLDVAGTGLRSAGLQELQSTLIAPPLVDVNAENNSMPIESLPTNMPYSPVRLAVWNCLPAFAGNHSLAIHVLSWIYVVFVLGIYVVVVYARNKYSAKEHIPYLLVQFLAITLAILVVVAS
ncbi:hypothetical protein KIW84_021059 [Lathyrus oleraceus]|uniref:Uncharacterized protein n=1 Tax=Pisum sativum TaxID=3888 RepID=A0A9D4Y6R9_PEA|nr:hypothetical protein KIW84_021059 [Pisum sativum]